MQHAEQESTGCVHVVLSVVGLCCVGQGVRLRTGGRGLSAFDGPTNITIGPPWSAACQGPAAEQARIMPRTSGLRDRMKSVGRALIARSYRTDASRRSVHP